MCNWIAERDGLPYLSIFKMATFTAILPCDNSTKISLILFKNVCNSAELRQSIRKGDMDASLIKAETVLDKFQVLTAANKAIHSRNTESMTTRSIYTEIIYCMSCTKNITDSLSKFGISDADTAILAVIVNDDGSKCEKLTTVIKGDLVPIEEVGQFAKEQTIKKIYKIKNEELKTAESLLNATVIRIATKDLVSF